jgi:hypothetical protein
MLNKLLNTISSFICLIAGHQGAKQVYTGKVAYVYHHSVRAHIPKPEIELQRVEFCLRCGKRLLPMNSDIKEKYDNL